MNRRRSASLTGLLVALSLTACAGPDVRGDAEVDMRLDVAPEPASVGPVMLTVAVTDLTWRPLNGASVKVLATSPGEEAEADEYIAMGIGAGKYQIPNFPLDEAGDWSFTVRVDLAGGHWAEMDRRLSVDESEDG